MFSIVINDEIPAMPPPLRVMIGSLIDKVNPYQMFRKGHQGYFDQREDE